MEQAALTRALAVLFPLLALACRAPGVADDYSAEAIPTVEIAGALADEDPTRRSEAAEQIEAMDAETRRRTLISLTRDGRPEIRLLAVDLIGLHHATDAEAASRLAEMLASDPDPDVRIACVSSLSRGDRRHALAPLFDALSSDPSLYVRADAAAALDRLTGQAIGRAVVLGTDAAESAADDASLAYEEWIQENVTEVRP
jgi:HEAT repeat protein